MDGAFTGIVGSAFAPAKDAYLAWVKTVNARGGIDGHPVKLLVSDNGSDASRTLANVKDFVENRGVIALVNLVPAAGADVAVARYAEKMHVAVVGGLSVDDVWNQSPVMFPAVTANAVGNYAYARAQADAGTKKVASVYCTENSICSDKEKAWADAAKSLGLQVVFRGQISLAQPDFTAQCLNARSAGAESVVVFADGASATRMAQSCSRQNYKPIIVTVAPAANPIPEMDGAMGVVTAFPWVVTADSPALDEYRDALKKYGTTAPAAYTTMGWTSGKLLEKALAHVSDTPTRDDVFNGLWSLQNETLGGLTPPLTFTKNQPTPVNPCWYVVRVANGAWTAPNGMRPSCK